jgi:hypothetical protein
LPDWDSVRAGKRSINAFITVERARTAGRTPEEGPMGIGASIFLLALGAILAFAVEADISGLDIGVIGWILMLAGLVGLIITLAFWSNRRRTVVTRTQAPVAGAGYTSEYREVRRDDVPPPPPPAYS